MPQDNLPLGERLARRWLDDWRGAAVLVALLALASSITSITNGFAYDDVAIVLDNPRIKEWKNLWRLFGEPYWLIEAFARDLYRPLVLVSFGVQWAIGGGNPMVFHAVSIGLYVVGAVLLLALLRRFATTRAAVAGAALWAVHPVHVESVGNVVGQAELMVGATTLGALLVYVRARQHGTLTPKAIALVGTLYAVGLLSKEHAIVFPGLLLVAEVALRRRGVALDGIGATRAWLLARVLLWEAIAFLLLRFIVLGNLQGSPHFSFWGLSHLQRILAATSLWPDLLRVMVWPARLYADYAPPQFPVRTSLGPVHAVALLLLAGWGWGVWWAWSRRHAAVLIGVLTFPVAYLTTSNLLFPTGVLIAERTLFLPSLSVGFLATALVQRLAVEGSVVRRLAGLLVGILLMAGVVRSAQRQTSWADSLSVFTTMVVDSPENGRGHAVIGQLFFGFGEWDRAEFHLATAYALHDGYGYLLADALQRRGQCHRALPLADSLVTKFRWVQPLQVTRTICLLEARRFSEARLQVRGALARGFTHPAFRQLALVGDSLLASYDSIDARNIWVRLGKPYDRTGDDVKVSIAPVPSGGGLGLIFGGRSEALR